MWKPPFRVKRYANAKYKFLVRGKVDGKWKRRYFFTEPEAIAFAEEQNAAAEKRIAPPLQLVSAPAPRQPVTPAQLPPGIQSLDTIDFTHLEHPVYLGPRIERYLGDSWCMHLPFAYDLMRELAPKVFVELGVKQGESYFAFCQSAADHKINVRCYGVDSWLGDVQTGNLDPEIQPEVARYNWLYSSFSELKVMLFAEAVGDFADESIDLLHIDGTHTYAEVKTDFEAWLPKLSPDGVILFHDVVVRGGGFGVWKLWEEIRGENNSFLFEFGHGLGVWKKQAVKESDPAFVRRLMTANEAERRELNRFYANAAAALALWQQVQKQPDTAVTVSRLRQEAAEKEIQITHFQRETDEKIRDLQQRIVSLNTEADQLRESGRKTSGLERALETLRNQLEQKEDLLNRASKDLLDAQWEALTLRGRVLSNAECPDASFSRVLELENRAELAESDREHLREMVTGLEKDVESARLSQQSGRQELKIVHEQLEATQDQLKATQDQLKATQDQLKGSQDQLELSAKGLRLYRKQMDRLRRNALRKLILPFGRSQRKLQELTADSNHD
jgi:cephalosporin hydroxylase